MTVMRVLFALLSSALAWTETSVLDDGKAIIGYWGSASDLPPEFQLADALRRGYNVIAVAFGDTLSADGSFEIHTNLGAPPTKAEISRNAGISGDSWQYILYFGGENAAEPYVTDVDGFPILSVDKPSWWWVMHTCNEIYKLETQVTEEQCKEFMKSTGFGYPGGSDRAENLELPVTNYSDGWKMKMQLCAAQLMNCDVVTWTWIRSGSSRTGS